MVGHGLQAVRSYSDGGGAMSVMKTPPKSGGSRFWWPGSSSEQVEVRCADGSRHSRAAASSSKPVGTQDAEGGRRPPPDGGRDSSGASPGTGSSSSEEENLSARGRSRSARVALVDAPHRGAVRPPLSRKSLLMAVLACAVVGLLLAAALALFVLLQSRGAVPLRSTTQEQRLYVRFAAPNCTDAPGWANGWAGCAVEPGGHDPQACRPDGWTCQAYADKGWCRNATAVPDFLGSKFNNPENGCCVCGGGAAIQAAVTAAWTSVMTATLDSASYAQGRWRGGDHPGAVRAGLLALQDPSSASATAGCRRGAHHLMGLGIPRSADDCSKTGEEADNCPPQHGQTIFKEDASGSRIDKVSAERYCHRLAKRDHR
eukprot:CAMPEP_0204593522 /NCGR_PEP_ID=MMETSP0661-20131031/51558_1 /ASSEMBLY_ACC=CAM_ASM_000606 /TAXON_ID=109239 /ORGANISM="Alexandrium margalefi, Strain AMGDE01CS-322" /LENGTH=371 /DNA_ID=CAMNT_0051603841 /DNA_START=35 /DNA_END=1147 /DNA_ORIENTATION=-